MKKNDFAAVIAYLLMIGAGILMGFMVIKPILDEYSAMISTTLNPTLLVILSLVGGIILDSVLLELGHFLGAKAGKYEILSFVILGFGMKKTKEKKKVGFHSFEGLVGETTVRPLDANTSSLGLYIFFPVLILIAEVITFTILASVGNKSNGSLAWLSVMSYTMLAVTIMIYIYDLFPAHIDSENDGHLLTLLTKPANKVAYNHILERKYCEKFGLEIPAPVIYHDVTEFTAQMNIVQVVNLLVEGKSAEADAILAIHLDSEARIPASVHNQAMCYRLALLLERRDKAAGKKYYAELTDAERRYIAELPNSPAMRCYALISAYIEDSENECNYALGRVERLLKACPPEILEGEKTLVDSEVKLIRSDRISWEVDPLPWEASTVIPEAEEAARKAEEERAKREAEEEAAEAEESQE